MKRLLKEEKEKNNRNKQHKESSKISMHTHKDACMLEKEARNSTKPKHSNNHLGISGDNQRKYDEFGYNKEVLPAKLVWDKIVNQKVPKTKRKYDASSLTKDKLDQLIIKVNFVDVTLGDGRVVRRQNGFRNCSSSVHAGAEAMSGREVSAVGDMKEKPEGYFRGIGLANLYKDLDVGYIYVNQSARKITQKMKKEGHGAIGVIAGVKKRYNGKYGGHTLNVVNINNDIYFVDFQDGRYKTARNVNSYNQNPKTGLTFTSLTKKENIKRSELEKLSDKFLGGTRTYMSVKELRKIYNR